MVHLKLRLAGEPVDAKNKRLSVTSSYSLLSLESLGVGHQAGFKTKPKEQAASLRHLSNAFCDTDRFSSAQDAASCLRCLVPRVSGYPTPAAAAGRTSAVAP